MIKKFIKAIISIIIYNFEKLKGSSFYFKINTCDDPQYNICIKFITTNNACLSVKVLTHKYIIKYSLSDYLTKDATVYEVIGYLPAGVKNKAKELYLKPLYFPKLLSKHVSETKQVEAVVNAFLDIKKNEIKDLK